jgi:hypothetical protein
VNVSGNSSSSRFEIPASLGRRIDSAAAFWSVPPQAVIGAAVAHSLAQNTRSPFAIFMPMTLRRSPADFESVGCFATSLPVLADVHPDEPPSDAVARWHQSVLATMDNGEADPGEVERALQAALPGWASWLRVSLAFESPSAGRAGEIEWAPVPQVPGPAKHDLALFVTEEGGAARQCRVQWRTDAVTRQYVTGLVHAILAHLAHVCGQPETTSLPRATHGGSQAAAPASAPRQPGQRLTSAAMTALLSAVLGTPLGPDDDVFQAGATSLHLLKIVAAVRAEHGISIRAVDIFDYPTGASLASVAERPWLKDEGASS